VYIFHGAMCLRSLYRLVLLGLLCAGTALGEDRFFGSAGVRIRYVDRGAGPPVVLVHGFTASIETSWIDTSVLPDLARDYRGSPWICAGTERATSRAMREPTTISAWTSCGCSIISRSSVRTSWAIRSAGSSSPSF
jgi:hypothetical protein